ncbi:hypothetical protein ACXET9_02695 [Brachybacterium sp. DNPG3]
MVRRTTAAGATATGATTAGATATGATTADAAASAAPAVRRALLGLSALCLAAAGLAGCTMPTGGTDPDGDTGWALDEDSGRYYRTGLLELSSGTVREHFPSLTGLGTVTFADGSFTEPGGREILPAQDDYWWQARVELDPAVVAALIEDSSSDAETIPDETLRLALVPTLEQGLPACPDGWVSVADGLAEDTASSDHSAAGDAIEVAAVCPGGDELVLALHDM